MDYNKLIKGIIKAAKKDSTDKIGLSETDSDPAKLTTTLRVEVKVSNIHSDANDEEAVNSTRFVLLRIDD